jgi:tetraacyldisaccharide 4'-kinase
MPWRLRDVLERWLEQLWYGKRGSRFALLFLPFGLLSMVSRLASYRRHKTRGAIAPLPTAGVGNLVVGGSGKTQVVLELGRRAQMRGLRSALIVRGYGGGLAGSVVVESSSPSSLVGDEACLLARRLPDARVIAGPDRLASALLARRASVQLAILDDGLQQRRLEVDRKVWLLSADAPFGNGHLLPLGPMRDPIKAIAPEDLVWLHGEGTPPQGLRVSIRSRSRAVGLVTAVDLQESSTAISGMRVAAFCGIARPDRFLASLRRAGAVVLNWWARADHRVFSGAELMHAARIAKARGASALVCTEKDAVRLPAIALPLPLFALRVELEISSGAELIDELLENLGKRS